MSTKNCNVTRGAGLVDSLLSTIATWLDYDRDGYLDLYVSYPDPITGDRLYRNNGDGTFTDMARQAGLDLAPDQSATALGSGDFNDDGWPDLYLAIALQPNRLFLSNGQGGFQDATTDETALPGAGVGMAIGDIDNDGDLDFLITTPLSLFLNDGEGFLPITPLPPI
jgi:hypothetical protein